MSQPEYTADENRCAEEWKDFFASAFPSSCTEPLSKEDEALFARQFHELAAEQRERSGLKQGVSCPIVAEQGADQNKKVRKRLR